jgi:hypothetical protein
MLAVTPAPAELIFPAMLVRVSDDSTVTALPLTTNVPEYPSAVDALDWAVLEALCDVASWETSRLKTPATADDDAVIDATSAAEVDALMGLKEAAVFSALAEELKATRIDLNWASRL